MKIACTDIETNNLYLDVTKFHCAWIIDPTEPKNRKGFRPDELDDYLKELQGFDVVIGHNVVDYDFPTLAKLSGTAFRINTFDTLVLSRMLQPDRLGGHSLKSWGRELGVLKGAYGEGGDEVWDVFNEDMFKYCEDDVEVTVALYKHLCELAGFDWLNPPCSRIFYK